MKRLCHTEAQLFCTRSARLAAAAFVLGCWALGGPREAEGGTLLASGGDEDEVWGFLPKSAREEPRPRPERRRPERPAPPRRKPAPRPERRPREPDELAGGIVLRGGLLVSVSGDEGNWRPAGSIGFGYRWAEGTRSRTIYDFGLDFASVERYDGLVSSNLYSLRGEVLFGDWSARRQEAVIYVLGGAHALFAGSTWDSRGGQESSAATGLEVGVGIGSASGRWDVRAVYSFLAGSRNVKGNILLAAGFSL